MKLKSFSLTAAQETVNVSDALFKAEVKPELVAQAVRVYLSNQRQSAAKTKTRGEVNLTTAKVYRQKGTGNARHGAKSAPIFVGGGVSHGPTGQENWKLRMPPQMGRRAVVYALSMVAANKQVAIATDLQSIEPKAKAAQQFLDLVGEKGKKLLIIQDGAQDNVLQAFRNLSQVTITRADRVHAYEIINAGQVVVMEPALALLEARLIKKEAK
jgi:large subunit ribosomal protein L4